ncbi:MAG: hypothetical protein KDE48_05255 [Anaerolineales bacterium]|nr:hypothetical protein [Anaerolineales bacterium]
MTTKSDYTEEEWNGLMTAPIMAGTYIIAADVSMTAMGKEMKGMLQAIQKQDVPDASKELVAAIVADIVAKSSNKEKMEAPEMEKDADGLQQILDGIVEATAVLETKSNPDEAAGYKQWVLDVAQATAEAGKEGGFLGIGAVRVSDKEKAALAKLKSTLGLD